LDAQQAAGALLDENTVLLEYKICAERSYGWVVTNDAVYSVELVGREKIRALVSRLSTARAADDTLDADRDLLERRSRFE